VTRIKNTTKRKFGDRQLQEICQYIIRSLNTLKIVCAFELRNGGGACLLTVKCCTPWVQLFEVCLFVCLQRMQFRSLPGRCC